MYSATSFSYCFFYGDKRRFFRKTKMPITSEPLNLFEQTKIYKIAQDLGYNILKGRNLIRFRRGIIECAAQQIFHFMVTNVVF